MYKVYDMMVTGPYSGTVLIAASSAEEANKLIRNFKASDPDNKHNSYAYEADLTENDVVEGLFAEDTGWVYDRVTYTG